MQDGSGSLMHSLARWISLMFLAGACLPAAVCGQGWAQKMFPETSHDFGDVIRGARPEHVFVIENIYEEMMVIDYVRSSCGCTKVSVDRQQLRTWEKAQITARFDTVAYAGKREATISVGFAHPFRAEVKLTVRGNIITDVQCYPQQIEFGSVLPRGSVPQVITITRRNNPNFRIADVRSTFSHVGVQYREVRRDAQEVVYQMQVWLKDDVPSGMVQSELNVIAQESSQPLREIRIPVQFTAKVMAPLQISPSVLNIPNAIAGQTVTQRVLLKADEPFRVRDVVCDDQAFSVRADGESRKVHFVEVSYRAPGEACCREANLQFITDLVAQPEISLPAIVRVNNGDQTVSSAAGSGDVPADR